MVRKPFENFTTLVLAGAGQKLTQKYRFLLAGKLRFRPVTWGTWDGQWPRQETHIL